MVDSRQLRMFPTLMLILTKNIPNADTKTHIQVDARRAGARGATPSRPDAEFIESVKSLAKDERNTVFLLSSQETSMVQEWFPKELWDQFWYVSTSRPLLLLNWSSYRALLTRGAFLVGRILE